MHIHTHNNGTASLTFTENPKMKHKTQKQPIPNIVKTHHYNMAVLIIFSVILQTVINLIMLSIKRIEKVSRKPTEIRRSTKKVNINPWFSRAASNLV